MFGHLCALAPGQGRSQYLRQVSDGGNQAVAHGVSASLAA